MNKRENKAVVVRQKIIQYYFMNGYNYKNKEEFVNMELNMIPHVIAWMGMDDFFGVSLLYNFARIVPSLFDSESMKAVIRKRKRQMSKSKRLSVEYQISH